MDHKFNWYTYTSPTNCNFCDSLLWGVYHQGLRFEDNETGLKLNIHKACLEKFERGENSKNKEYVDKFAYVYNKYYRKDYQRSSNVSGVRGDSYQT